MYKQWSAAAQTHGRHQLGSVCVFVFILFRGKPGRGRQSGRRWEEKERCCFSGVLHYHIELCTDGELEWILMQQKWIYLYKLTHTQGERERCLLSVECGSSVLNEGTACNGNKWGAPRGILQLGVCYASESDHVFNVSACVCLCGVHTSH